MLEIGFQISLYDTNHPYKDMYDKVYTISYYSGFYSSLKDKIWANDGHIDLSYKDEDK